MKGIEHIVVAGMMVLMLASCSKEEEEDSPCGTGEEFEIDYNFVTNPADTALLHMYYYQPDMYTTRLEFWRSFDSLCTAEHILAGQTIEVSNKHACFIWAEMALCPGISRTEFTLTLIPVAGDRMQYKSGMYNEGLKQCYDDGPGKFWLITKISFTKKATRALDMEYFFDSLAPVFLYRYDFHWYKKPKQ